MVGFSLMRFGKRALFKVLTEVRSINQFNLDFVNLIFCPVPEVKFTYLRQDNQRYESVSTLSLSLI